MDADIHIHACDQICKHINKTVNLRAHTHTLMFFTVLHVVQLCYPPSLYTCWPCQPDAHRNLTLVFSRLTEPHIVASCKRLNQKYKPPTTPHNTEISLNMFPVILGRSCPETNNSMWAATNVYRHYWLKLFSWPFVSSIVSRWHFFNSLICLSNGTKLRRYSIV